MGSFNFESIGNCNTFNDWDLLQFHIDRLQRVRELIQAANLNPYQKAQDLINTFFPDEKAVVSIKTKKKRNYSLQTVTIWESD